MIDDLDKRAESRILSDQELNLKHYLNERLDAWATWQTKSGC